MSTPNNKLPLRHKIGAVVTPGDRLGLATRSKTSLVAGSGTYLRQGHLYASLLGTLCATHHHLDGASSNDEERESWIISVRPEEESSTTSSSFSPSSYSKMTTGNCPQVGMLVLGRITRVARPSHAMVDIVAIVPNEDEKQQSNKNSNSSSESHQAQQQQQPPPPFIVPLHEPFAGTLRQNELRPNSSLEIRIEDCVRPGDVVVARVRADGERDFVLSTAEAECGVIRALCESSGCEMMAVSWKEMQCPVTGVREGRKVAKPRQRVA
mmetsp:Transcript_40236/g.84502  ORF Transcript_40236/g.84502 Transcript_40236/m.84502 type:complete len:267 (+) Transcript_40236:183-983(+)|eukprot:CAMPEP_0183708652 /NCGR_PEP_ID=MMETSP0737-20130205/4885_1 /TAXON_ID=385413 /ORGANISM="Thalassiosira miniscula, Strain CCMP1093" /LENGTH=266 /DNA_ID=CAMNT_0025936547 /DNA_START=119 /DNA_END=919 /DNA_ORIENTATION=-